MERKVSFRETTILFIKKKTKKKRQQKNKRKEIDTSGRNWKTSQHYLLRICTNCYGELERMRTI